MSNIKVKLCAATTLLRGFARLAVVLWHGFWLPAIRRNVWPRSLSNPGAGAARRAPVFDIVNAGPRHRFAVVGEHGVYLAHNCLGLQYGMGASKLAIKLTADTGKIVSEDTARELINQHKQVYFVYYEWKDHMWERYRYQGKPLILAQDLWYLDTHNPGRLSILNFPLQGAGSAIMRHFIDSLLDQGIKVVCPVHDSCVIESLEAEAEADAAKVTATMQEAALTVLGVPGMRVGKPEIIRNGEFWVTEKNASSLKKYQKYFETLMESRQGAWLDTLLAD